ncbi:MAG: hypothetical protein H0W82_09015 [Actinobacteria bacterium]|nr:hypothetical protein [Actinomycetota bacterium]
MRKTPAALAIGIAIAMLVPSGIASATPPQRVSFPIDDHLSLDGVCAFDMTAHIVGKNHLIIFVDADGNPTRGFLAGQLSVTFTNEDTGGSRTFTISGPSFFDETLTIVRGTGRWATFTADGTFVIASGNFVMDGSSTILQAKGKLRDLCDLMA